MLLIQLPMLPNWEASLHHYLSHQPHLIDQEVILVTLHTHTHTHTDTHILHLHNPSLSSLHIKQSNPIKVQEDHIIYMKDFN